MSSKIIENIEQAIKRFDLINRPYIAFLNPDDVKVLKPVLPKIEKDIVIQSTAFVEKGKCVVMKREDLELSAIIEPEGEEPYRTRYEVGEEHPVVYEIKAEVNDD